MKPCLIHFAANRTPVDVSGLKNASVTLKGTIEYLRLSDRHCSQKENTSSFLIQLFEIKFQGKNNSREKRKLTPRTLVNGNRKIKTSQAKKSANFNSELFVSFLKT